MRVYHFLSAEFALKDLREQRLKISEISRLNDPFEFLGLNLSEPILRKAMKKTKNQLARKKGLLCFSGNWQNPVQWAHYADNHRGICFGFDIPNHLLNEITYVDKRLDYTDGFSEQDMLKLLTTKFSHWIYEKEFRILVDLPQKEDGFYYAPFDDSIVLKQVIIGATSSVTKAQIIESYELSKEIEIFKGRAAFQSFKIVRNQAYDRYTTELI